MSNISIEKSIFLKKKTHIQATQVSQLIADYSRVTRENF